MTSEFRIEGTDAVDFLVSNYQYKLSVRPIEDPFGKDMRTAKRVLDDIEAVVLSR